MRGMFLLLLAAQIFASRRAGPASGLYRDIAGFAVEVAAMRSDLDFEARRNEIEAVFERGDLGQLGLAGLAAAGAPEIFEP